MALGQLDDAESYVDSGTKVAAAAVDNLSGTAPRLERFGPVPKDWKVVGT